MCVYVEYIRKVILSKIVKLYFGTKYNSGGGALGLHVMSRLRTRIILYSHTASKYIYSKKTKKTVHETTLSHTKTRAPTSFSTQQGQYMSIII